MVCSTTKPQEHIWDLSSCGYLYPQRGSLGQLSPKPRPPVGKVGVAWGAGPGISERTTSLLVNSETHRFAPWEAVRASEIPRARRWEPGAPPDLPRSLHLEKGLGAI